MAPDSSALQHTAHEQASSENSRKLSRHLPVHNEGERGEGDDGANGVNPEGLGEAVLGGADGQPCQLPRELCAPRRERCQAHTDRLLQCHYVNVPAL